MNKTRAPPTFHEPKVVQSPEVTASLGDQAYIQDGILYRMFKSFNPL